MRVLKGGVLRSGGGAMREFAAQCRDEGQMQL